MFNTSAANNVGSDRTYRIWIAYTEDEICEVM